MGLQYPRTAIVEHDVPMIKFYMAALKVAKHELIGTTDEALQALDIVRREMPNYIIIDYRLRGNSDGLQLIEAIQPISPSTTTILATAWDLDDLRIQLTAVRPDTVLKKPFLLTSLLNALGSHGSGSDATSRVAD